MPKKLTREEVVRALVEAVEFGRAQVDKYGSASTYMGGKETKKKGRFLRQKVDRNYWGGWAQLMEDHSIPYKPQSKQKHHSNESGLENGRLGLIKQRHLKLLVDAEISGKARVSHKKGFVDKTNNNIKNLEVGLRMVDIEDIHDGGVDYGFWLGKDEFGDETPRGHDYIYALTADSEDSDTLQ